MKRKYNTMICGMAKMMRKPTESRPWGAVPAYHMSTRLVGIAIAALVMETP
jgi:hypothetical protein